MKTLLTLAVLANIICPQTELIDYTGKPWTKADYDWAYSHLDACSIYPTTPCTTAIVKRRAGYKIICGAPLDQREVKK